MDGKVLLYQVTNITGGTNLMAFDPTSEKVGTLAAD